jgi:hypothetical protein
MSRTKQPKSINPAIDDMIKKMKDSFDSLPPTDKINVIKTAIIWEKTKHSIKEGNEGDFFKDDDE